MFSLSHQLTIWHQKKIRHHLVELPELLPDRSLSYQMKIRTHQLLMTILAGHLVDLHDCLQCLLEDCSRSLQIVRDTLSDLPLLVQSLNNSINFRRLKEGVSGSTM